MSKKRLKELENWVEEKRKKQTRRQLNPVLIIEVDGKDEKKCGKHCIFLSYDLDEIKVECIIFRENLYFKTSCASLHSTLRCDECIISQVKNA